MTERVNTTSASGTTGAIVPTGEIFVQAQIDPKSKAIVEVDLRADAAAPWVPAGRIDKMSSPPILRFAQVQAYQIRYQDNDGGYTLKVWS